MQPIFFSKEELESTSVAVHFSLVAMFCGRKHDTSSAAQVSDNHDAGPQHEVVPRDLPWSL